MARACLPPSASGGSAGGKMQPTLLHLATTSTAATRSLFFGFPSGSGDVTFISTATLEHLKLNYRCPLLINRDILSVVRWLTLSWYALLYYKIIRIPFQVSSKFLIHGLQCCQHNFEFWAVIWVSIPALCRQCFKLSRNIRWIEFRTWPDALHHFLGKLDN